MNTSDKFALLYRNRSIFISRTELELLVSKSKRSAKDIYRTLEPPRAMSFKLFEYAWTKDHITNDIAKRSVKPVVINSPPEEFRASVDFYMTFPTEIQDRIRAEIHSTSPNKRVERWDNYDLDYKEIERAFIGLTKQRNRIAKYRGFSDFIDENLAKHNIPKEELELFMRDSDKLISFCHDNLPDIKPPIESFKEFSKPCYICSMPTFPFKSIEETRKYVSEELPLLKNFINKIITKLDSRISEMHHDLTNDSFIISIESINFRHKTEILIHELVHVYFYLTYYEKDILPSDIGSYHLEKEAFTKELELLEKSSKNLLGAMFGQTLKVFLAAIFEIELYNNPDQDLSVLYANVYNRCFTEANQSLNRAYIIEPDIVQRPLSTLPHAIALSSIISHKFKSIY